MLKSVFIILISIIGAPLYAICVALLYVIGKVFGIGYVDSSVYVCEYIQPLFTASLALLFLIYGLTKIPILIRKKNWGRFFVLCSICLLYITTGIYCVIEFLERLQTYSGMTNRQIFDFVVNKLRVMGDIYPHKTLTLFNGETIGFGYIMANIEVYLLPVSLVILLGLFQRKLTKQT